MYNEFAISQSLVKELLHPEGSFHLISVGLALLLSPIAKEASKALRD